MLCKSVIWKYTFKAFCSMQTNKKTLTQCPLRFLVCLIISSKLWSDMFGCSGPETTMVIGNYFMEEYFMFLQSKRAFGYDVNRSRYKRGSGKIPVITDARSKHVLKTNIQNYTLRSMFKSLQSSTAKILISHINNLMTYHQNDTGLLNETNKLIV